MRVNINTFPVRTNMADKTLSNACANTKDKPTVPEKRKFNLLDALFSYKFLLVYRMCDLNPDLSKHHNSYTKIIQKNNCIE